MKIIALLLALVLGLGFSMKQTANDQKEISFQHELNQYKSYPNLLPVVEVVGHKS
ncbi:hypothetical protein H8S95_16980 [Pontibacter sp. KCTC 32443]|nr:hypothetical protein [Pontibacter sp. KCTC 32443]